MPTLPELQADFARALLREDARSVAAAIVGDGLPAAARVQIYWNHVFSSLTEALEATFPVVCRLVDRRFFGFAADRYIHGAPADRPVPLRIRRDVPGLPGWLPAVRGLPVPRRRGAARVGDERRAPRRGGGAYRTRGAGAVASDDVGRLVLQLDPSASWLDSPWPVDRIWRANQPESRHRRHGGPGGRRCAPGDSPPG